MSPVPHSFGKESFDVLIAGGGPAGTATALALARRGLTAVVLERSTYGGVRVGESLPPEVQATLRELGVWERFLAAGHHPSLFNAVAWGGPRLTGREHLFSPYGQGWHLDRGRFDAMLSEAARELEVPVLEAARVESLARMDGLWRACVSWQGRRHELRAAWLIDATGRPAVFARRLGGRRIRADRLVGLAAFLAPQPGAEPLEPAILVETEENGWWYSAPLPDGRAVVSLFTDVPGSAAARTPAAWWSRLAGTLHTARRLSRHAPPAAVVVRAAEPSITVMPPVPGFLPVGDAAAAFDPLSGQGISAALLGGIEAAAALADASPRALAEALDRIRQRYESHLRVRQEYYAKERRWPDSPFWRKRLPTAPDPSRIRLDPERVFAAEPDAEARWALSRLEARLPELGLRAVCSACREPAPAHRIVRLLAQGAPAGASGALSAIQALQVLIEHGVITERSPADACNFPDAPLTS